MKVLAIIPCYNEEASIVSTVEGLKSAAPDVDFVVINDGSADGTLRVCEENAYPVISLPVNLGLASAVQTGMRYAYGRGYDMTLQFDGDGQHLPQYIHNMTELMTSGNADIVIGSRFLHDRAKSLRGLGSGVLRLAIRLTTGQTLSDPTSGMRLYNRRMTGRFAGGMDHGPEPDTLAFLINRGAVVVETPVVMKERTAGRSYLNFFAASRYMLRMIVSIIIIQWFRRGRDL